MRSFQLFYRYIFSQRSESILRTLGRLVMCASFVGVAALVVVTCVMAGFNQSMHKQLLAGTPHLEIRGHAEQIQQSLSDRNIDLKKQWVFEKQDVVLRTADGKFSGAVARGQTLDAINDVLRRLKESGQNHFYDGEIELLPGEVAISDSLSRQLRVYHGEELIVVPPEALLLPPGEVPVFERVRVKEIFSADVGELGLGGLFYVPGNTLLRFSKNKSLLRGVEALLNDPSQHKEVKAQLETLFVGNQVEVLTWADKNATTFFALKMERIAMLSMLSLAVLVTSFGVIMVLIMLVEEKREDIGLMLALGQSLRSTQSLFSGVGLWLSGFGLLGGLIFGLSIAYILKVSPLPEFPDIYSIRELPVVIDQEQMLYVSLSLFALALMASWLPVRRVLLLTPTEALRGFRRKR